MNAVGGEHFCLRWNNYESNLLSVFNQLLEDEQLVDVTLACEGRSLEAHKVVLSACSPFFQQLLVASPDRHPIIILKGVNFAELRILLDFMYKGEVNVEQGQLKDLLQTAEALKVKGLFGSTNTSTIQQVATPARRKRPSDVSRPSSPKFATTLSQNTKDSSPSTDSEIEDNYKDLVFCTSPLAQQERLSAPPQPDPSPGPSGYLPVPVQEVPMSLKKEPPDPEEKYSDDEVGQEDEQTGFLQSALNLRLNQCVEKGVLGYPRDIGRALHESRRRGWVSHRPGFAVLPTLPGRSATFLPAKPVIDQAVDNNGGEARVNCKFCDKPFMDQNALVAHVAVHSGDRPFKCRYCHKGFKLRHHQRDHERVHTGEKPFKCSICTKTFSRSTIVKAHEKTHIPKFFRNKNQITLPSQIE
ncbi:zinc finger and BTB domain-containing protein 17-like isoform X2 [Neocloeon triangulifer]|uniref:zinc finger and BTB domain-containing protein 17-like isoform X2 n=1 Tax=Neocloeon triangulifer TaxID=2078957 RepID=UPI00286F3E0D|nr:zinc finger and BTB domain-containing protein 17-like isoform X2 [Neocloeon triangulifer]